MAQLSSFQKVISTGSWSCSAIFSNLIPPALKTANLLGLSLKKLGIRTYRLEVDVLLAEAERQTGLHDFGLYFNHGHLARLVTTLREEACLNSVGQIMAYSDLVHLLINRLRLAAEYKRNPLIAAQSISSPIFVTGLPRTGTTLLHRLLAQDPAHRAPRTWEIMQPWPPLAGDRRSQEARIRLAENQLCWFQNITGIDRVHGIGAVEPEECIAVTAHSFASARFHVTYWAPAYERWLRWIDRRPVYEYHKCFLQYLQAGEHARRWLLKAPAHIESLPALVATYPDALIVQMHRDPMTVLASVASLTSVMQSPFRERIAPERIGRQVIDRWAWAVDRSIQDRVKLHAKGVRFVDIYYEDIIRDPLAAAREIYRASGRQLEPEAEHRMKSFLATHTQDRHGIHVYDPATFSIDPGKVRAAFKNYYDYYNIKGIDSARAA